MKLTKIIIIALAVFHMPVQMIAGAVAQGMVYGWLRIAWIVVAAVFVYEITVDASNNIHVDMTLTSPGCPAGPQIMTDVERALQALPSVGDVELNLVWSPYWTPERIEPRVRAYMGL